MSKPESLELSAEDLMPSWVSDIGLDKAPIPPSARENDRDGDRQSRSGKGRGGQGSNRSGAYGKDDRRQGGRGRGDSRGRDRGGRNAHREDRQPQRAEDIVPEVEFIVEPTPEAVTALAKQIRSINRAYAVADIAKTVLAGADRYRVIYRVKSERNTERNKKQGAPGERPSRGTQPKPFHLVRCKTDGSVWLSREEAIAHVLNTPELIKEFYEVEEVTTEAPKGNFAVIAVCGMSGAILGPPNHHEYQQNIARIHRERFGSMPLEKFKSRIKMSRDEETIEQWKQEMSTARHYRVRTEKPRVAHGEGVEPKDGAEKQVAKKEIAENEMDGGELNEGTAPSDGDPPAVSGAGVGPVADSVSDEPIVESPDDSTEATSTDGAGGGAEPEEQQLEGQAGLDDGEPSETSGEDTGSVEEAAPAEADDGGEAEEQAQANAGQSSNDTAGSEPAITSMGELTRHFREHFAKRIFKEVGEVRLPGTASAREMSPALHERMVAEINWQKRGFPLPMVRVLCRRFEQQGLKFFKRGEKTLFVSAARPRSLAEGTVLSDRLLLMLNYINEHPGTLAGELIKHFLGGNGPGIADEGKTPESQAESSKVELGLLADLRWLLAEGYLIEFPSSELLPATAVSVDKRKRRPSKRPKKKRLPEKKVPTTGAPSSETGKPSTAPAPEAPVSVPTKPEG